MIQMPCSPCPEYDVMVKFLWTMFKSTAYLCGVERLNGDAERKYRLSRWEEEDQEDQSWIVAKVNNYVFWVFTVP